jgi:two-component system sensor histidine kinase YesM
MLSSFRLKIMVISVLITLAIQIVCITSGLINLNNYSTQMAKLNYDRHFQTVNQSIGIKFNTINALLIKLQTGIFLDFVSGYYNLKSSKEVGTVQNKALNELNSMPINPALVSKIYMVSGNLNQMSFSKKTLEKYFSKESIPHYDLLERVGFTKIVTTDGKPIRFSYDEFNKKINNNANKLNKDEMTSLKELALNLKDQTIMCMKFYAGDPGAVIILVLGNDFECNELLKSNKNEKKYKLTLVDDKKNIIFSDFSGNMNVLEENCSKSENISGRYWYSNEDGIRWIHRSFVISKYTMYVDLSMKLNAESNNYSDFSEVLVILIFCILISLITSYYLTKWIILPLDKISTWMKGSGYKLPVEEINLDKLKLTKVPNLKTTKKLMLIFLLSVIIPNFLSCIIYSTSLFTKMEEIAQENFSIHTKNLQRNISELINTCSFVNQLMATDISEQLPETYNRILMSSDSSMLMDKFITQANYYFNQEYTTWYFSYFVITDSLYRVIYKSIFSSKPEVLSDNVALTPVESVGLNKDNTITYFSEDLLNRPAVAITKSISYQGKNTNNKQSGYFMMFLQPNIFDTIISEPSVEYVILDPQRHVAFRNNSRDEYTKAAVKISRINRLEKPSNQYSQYISSNTINGIKYMMISQEIEQTGGWEFIMFERISDIYFNSWYTMGLYIIIMLLSLLTCIPIISILSSIIYKPLNTIIESISQLGNDSNKELVKYSNGDETGQLVAAYNGMAIRIKNLIEENADIRLHEQELISLKTQAELNMLQQQINPHFLYNSLEVINFHSKQSGDQISSKMASALANIFRYNTSTTKNTVAFEQELFHIKNYLVIQELRFNSKFITTYDIDPNTLTIRVMKLILQPILENCINHGIYEYTKGGKISVASRITDGMLEIEIIDNGIGMKASDLENLRRNLIIDENNVESIEMEDVTNRKGNGIALKNIYKRLLLFYGDHMSFQIDSIFMQGTTVRLHLPIQK